MRQKLRDRVVEPLLQRLRQAIPPPRSTALLSLAWAALIAISVIAYLALREWRAPRLIFPVAAVCFFGALLSFPLARFAARLFAPVPQTTRRIAADLVFHAGFTVIITALVHAFIFRSYFAQWHGDIFSPLWIFSFIFTMAGAMYSFLVLGVPMLMPGFVAALIAYILWIALRRR